MQTVPSNNNDRKALLTTVDNPSKKSKHSKCVKTTIVISILALIIVILIMLVVILDVFALFEDKSEVNNIAGLIGLWPVWGGNIQNHQIPPYGSPLNITNIKNVTTICVYKSTNGRATGGYPVIDDNFNAYINDASGWIRSINLDTCQENWNKSIGELLGYNNSMIILQHNSLTLYQNSNGIKGLLFAAPSHRGCAARGCSTYPNDRGCFAISVYLNGSFWWKVTLGADFTKHGFRCSSHGFIVDGKYAYGGMAQSGGYNLQNGAKFIGGYYKIDIDTHKIENIWYPFNFNDTNNLDENNKSYNGASSYAFGSIIDKYLIFGTGNLFRGPTYIDQCMLANDTNFNDFLPLNKSNYIDICGNNQSHNFRFRCLENNVWPSSLIVLNKHTMKLEKGLALQGADINYNRACRNDPNANQYCPSRPGFNSDLVAVSGYKYKDKLYAIGSSKSGRLVIFDILSDKTLISRKFGPQSTTAHFNMAVDERSMIGITSINGLHNIQMYYRYKLLNGMMVCKTGSTLAFNLSTGNILWQVVHPYGNINTSYCWNDTLWDEYIDYTEQDNTNCNYGFNENNDNINVIIPPKNDTYLPDNIEDRATFLGAVTIVNNMAIIPSDSGDIWIHNLFTGEFIHHLVCPNNTISNRPGIKGGVSVVNDRLIYYCGSYDSAPAQAVNGNMLISMQLKKHKMKPYY
eukprot:227243_1